VIEEKGVEGMGETEEEIAMIEPNVEIEARGSMMGKEEEVSLNVGEHLEGAAAVAMAEVTVEMATKEVVAGLHEARMDLHENNHSEHQAARKIGFLTRDHYNAEAKDTRAQYKDFDVHAVLKH